MTASESVAAGFRKILCPVDFSEFSRHAVDQAVAIAHCYGAAVRALYVLSFPFGDPMVSPMVVAGPEALEQARQELGRFVLEEVGRTIECHTFQGSPVETIVSEAAAWPADLIVMGTHGRTGFQHLMLGSVTERILRKAHCPVLTVPKRAPDVVPAGPVAFRRILCATDFTVASGRALTYAESLARQSNAHLTLVHVVEPVSASTPVLFERIGPLIEDIRTACIERVHTIAPKNLDVAEAVLVGKPYKEIIKRAVEDQADLIVVGVHAGLADRFHIGSTTNHIVREAECCVLSVR